ncbi:hypothetical protein RUM44_012543 [Polyplax serrata]|uniref:Uncharacterized protein n=1 Tax=Polyplax serrata TaxID=468196 RepID=A0ABR1BBM6_POLSC
MSLGEKKRRRKSRPSKTIAMRIFIAHPERRSIRRGCQSSPPGPGDQALGVGVGGSPTEDSGQQQHKLFSISV